MIRFAINLYYLVLLLLVSKYGIKNELLGAKHYLDFRRPKKLRQLLAMLLPPFQIIKSS